MPKFCANLTMLWNELDFMDRFAAAAKAGFNGVEYLFPYDHDKNRSPEQLQAARPHAGAAQPPGGQLGQRRARHRLPSPAGRANSRTASARRSNTRTALGCKQVNCLAGIRPSQLDPGVARETFIKNLQYAAPRLKDAGIKLLIEPINTRDIPGFFLNNSKQALDIIKAVGSRQPVPAIRHLPHADHGRRPRPHHRDQPRR